MLDLLSLLMTKCRQLYHVRPPGNVEEVQPARIPKERTTETLNQEYGEAIGMPLDFATVVAATNPEISLLHVGTNSKTIFHLQTSLNSQLVVNTRL